MEGWQITLLGKRPTYLEGGEWKDFDGQPKNYERLYDSLPEAICAAVEALVAEKRAKDKGGLTPEQLADAVTVAVDAMGNALGAEKRAKAKDARLDKLIVPGVARRIAKAASKLSKELDSPSDELAGLVSSLADRVAKLE